MASGGRVALHGIRGVGKTVLAAAYALRHRGDYLATWWINTETDSTMRADLGALGIRLGWIGADASERDALSTVADALRDRGDGILLIFDDAKGPKAIREFLPRSGSAHVLVTSNNHAWRSVATPLEIGTWSAQVGAEYLQRRTGRDERAESERLSEGLGGLPLALEQAAAYCEELEIGFAEYRSRFEAAPATVLGTEDYSAAGYRDGQTTVAKTFRLAIAAANDIDPAAETLINHASLLAPEPIPLFFLSEGRRCFVEEARQGLAGRGLEEALKALRAFALLYREQIVDERDGTKKTDAIRLHRLVRVVARECRSGAARDGVLRGLIGAMAHVYPRDVAADARSWPRARRLDPLAYGLVMRDSEPPRGAAEETSYLLNQLASYRMKATFAYRESEQLFRASLAINERVFGPDHIRVASVLNNLASLLHATGATGDAESLFRRSLAINEVAYGARDPRVAAILGNLAACLEKADRFGEAETLYQRALEIDEQALGPSHRSVARDLSNLGEILRITNRLSDAEPFYRRALAIIEADSAEEDLELASMLSNLATLLSDTNRFDEAEPLYQRALQIDERALGPEHPEVATILDMLGNGLRDASRLMEAKDLHERALAIREAAFGPDHPEVGLVVSNLGDTLATIGDFDGAEAHFRRAMAIFERKLGATHHKVASVLNNLGNILAETGRSPDAESLYRRALVIDEAVFGPNHPRISTDLNNIATLLREAGRFEDAEPLYRRALAIDEAGFGTNHFEVANDLNNLALTLKETNRTQDAEALFRRALDIYEASAGKKHPRVAGLLFNLATLLRITGRTQEALADLERAATILFKQAAETGQFPPNLHGVLETYGNALRMDFGKSEAETDEAVVMLGARNGFWIGDAERITPEVSDKD